MPCKERVPHSSRGNNGWALSQQFHSRLTMSRACMPLRVEHLLSIISRPRPLQTIYNFGISGSWPFFCSAVYGIVVMLVRLVYQRQISAVKGRPEHSSSLSLTGREWRLFKPSLEIDLRVKRTGDHNCIPLCIFCNQAGALC